MKKILLLTDVPPCKEFSGGLLTDSLCRYEDSENIVCAVVRNKELNHIMTSENLGIETLYLTKPRESSISFLKGKFNLYQVFNFFYELYSEFIYTKQITKHVIKFGRQHNIDRVWCILQGQTIIRLAEQVANGLEVPLLTQVWDDVSWWIGHNNINKITSKRITKQYHKAIYNSVCFGAPSFAMAKDIENKGVRSIPLVSTLPSEVISKKHFFPDENRKVILIGFSGQIYAEESFNAFLECLQLLNWKINNREIKLRFLGYSLSLGGHVKRNVEYLGYRSQAETIRLLSECDLLFCPYIIDPKYSKVAQTSFPAKLTTYLATGVPVLFCGTEDSSPAIFLREHEAGFICSDINSGSLRDALLFIFSNKLIYEKISENGLKTFRVELTNDKQKIMFSRFINYGDSQE